MIVIGICSNIYNTVKCQVRGCQPLGGWIPRSNYFRPIVTTGSYQPLRWTVETNDCPMTGCDVDHPVPALSRPFP
jgi:hypothetical protein